jgi:ribose transport system permease protein
MSTLSGKRSRTAFLNAHRSIVGAYLIAIVMFVVTSAFTSGFSSSSNVRYLLVSATFIGLVGLGQTFVVLGGGVDLSIPYTLNAVALLTTVWADGRNDRLVWVLPAALGVALGIGLLNGIGVALLGVSPIIMTLGMNVVVEGAVLVYMGSEQPGPAPHLVDQFALGRAGPIPVSVLIWFAAIVLATLALAVTVFGRRLYAVGTSRTVSEFSGVSVAPVQIATYMISALSAGVAGVLVTGFTGQAYLGMGDQYLFASVAAVAVGGAPLIGGSGNYLGTVAGALVLTLLAGLLPVLNLDEGWTQIIYGLMILGTVALATARRRIGTL